MVVDLTIIGQSKLAINLAKQFEAANLPIQLLTRDHKAIEGKIVLFTLPYEDMISLIYPNQDYLVHKVIIDKSPSLQHGDQTGPANAMQSTALGLAERFPHLTIVKAVDTRWLDSPDKRMLLAGDNSSAKDRFGQLLTAAGWQVLDMGPLDKSPDLEAFARVQHLLSETKKQGNK